MANVSTIYSVGIVYMYKPFGGKKCKAVYNMHATPYQARSIDF